MGRQPQSEYRESYQTIPQTKSTIPSGSSCELLSERTFLVHLAEGCPLAGFLISERQPMKTSTLESLFQEHQKKTSAIWDKLEQDLVDKYMAEGYWRLWAEVKANNDVLELRSRTRNPHPMPSRVPPSYDMGGNNE